MVMRSKRFWGGLVLLLALLGMGAWADSKKSTVYYIPFKEIVHRASADYLIRALQRRSEARGCVRGAAGHTGR